MVQAARASPRPGPCTRGRQRQQRAPAAAAPGRRGGRCRGQHDVLLGLYEAHEGLPLALHGAPEALLLHAVGVRQGVQPQRRAAAQQRGAAGSGCGVTAVATAGGGGPGLRLRCPAARQTSFGLVHLNLAGGEERNNRQPSVEYLGTCNVQYTVERQPGRRAASVVCTRTALVVVALAHGHTSTGRKGAHSAGRRRYR